MDIDNNPKNFYSLSLAKNLTFGAESATRLCIYVNMIFSGTISQISDINKKTLYTKALNLSLANAKKSLTTGLWGQVHNKIGASYNLTN